MVKLLSSLTALFVFLLPWQARYLFSEYSLESPYYGGLSIYLIDAVFVLLLLAWLVWVWPKRKSIVLWYKDAHRAWRFSAIALLCFCLFSLISVVWFPFDSPTSHGFWQMLEPIALVKWLRLMQAVLFAVIIATIPIRARVIFLAVIAGALVQSFFAIHQFFVQEISASTWLGMSAQNPRELGVSVIEYADQRWLRAHGTLPHPNILGAYLSLAALAACAWFYSAYRQIHCLFESEQEPSVTDLKKVRMQVVASLSSFCILLLGLLFSFSRTAWLGFAAGWLLLTALLFLPSDRAGRRLIFWSGLKQAAFGAMLLAALTFMLGPLWTSRVQDDSRVAKISQSERSELVEQAQQVISQQPWRGSGIGSYVVKIRELAPDADIFMYQPVHNVWLLLWAELGAVGLLPFAGYLAFLLYCFRLLWGKKELSLDTALIMAAVFAVGLMAYFEHFWWTLQFGQMLAAVWLGLLMHAMISSSRDSQRMERHVTEGIAS